MERRTRDGVADAFTLVELLVVMAILAILASLLLPALATAKARSLQIACVGNHRQLQLGWRMYADEHDDGMPANESLFGAGPNARADYIGTARSWVSGNAWTDTNASNIASGVLFAYNRDARIYKCPGDRSKVRDQGRIARLRSVAMNHFLNHKPDPAISGFWRRVSQLPSPSGTLVFIDEHENSIENGNLWAQEAGEWNWRWYDFPTTRHSNGAALSFADGHAGVRRWVSPQTIRVSRTATYLNFWVGMSVPRGDRDLAWYYDVVQRPPP
ncbi:MAG: prepilin-type N-terminal cleavage/methylation domain-containing protein [Verrucomicrobiales bacterium]|nr:prepilin-type N-terminal cleavage/methylation domain-containing protein [Verrucomicrobiales bacterium]